MTFILELFILIPLAGFLISLLIPDKKEGAISATVYCTVAIHHALFWLFIVLFLLNDRVTMNLKDIVCI